MITLSEDQAEARDAIMAALRAGAREMVLTGPAGSGKTTLMRDLIDRIKATGRPFKLLAPTGKAAARLRDLTGQQTSTIHQPLYRRIEENGEDVKFSDPRAVLGHRGVVIVDEASMVGKALHRDLLGVLGDSVQILWVGDREQLQPVGDVWGADFTNPTANLSQIHRQAQGSPIIRFATGIREGNPWRLVVPPGVDEVRVSHGPERDAVDWLTFRRAIGADATLLTFSNKTRRALNLAVRDVLGMVGPLSVGDRLVCVLNSHALGIMNGEVREVVMVEPLEGFGGMCEVEFDDGRRCLIASDFLHGCDNVLWRAFADALPEWMGKRLIRAEYGECLTVHKSQGSQWSDVGLVHDSALDWFARKDPDGYRRLMYTAVTRASSAVAIFEV